MKQQVSPIVAVIIIVVVAGIAYFAWHKLAGSPAGAAEGQKPPGMPASVQAEFQRRTGGNMTGPPQNANTGPSGITPLTPGGTTAPPPTAPR